MKETRGPALIAAAPLRELLRMIRDAQASIGIFLPDADAVHLLRRLGDELQHALQRAASDSALLTIPEVAKGIRLSEEAVRWKVRQGHLPATQVGREYRVSLDDLLAFMAHPHTKPARE